MPLGTEVGLGVGDIVLVGDPAPPKRPHPPIFGLSLLWPNVCTYQGTTWYRGRPRCRRHCVRWGPRSPSPKGAEPPHQFAASVRCGQTVGWTKMPLGMEVGLSPGDFVFNKDLAPPRRKRAQPHPIFGRCLLWPSGWMDQDATWYGGKPRPRRRCVRWGRSSPPP